MLLQSYYDLYRHEKTKHPDFNPKEAEVCEHDDSSSTSIPEQEVGPQSEDYKLNYHKAKLKFGMLLMDINDAIREADGVRLVNIYKFALLIYKCYGHTKYAYTTLLFLVNVHGLLTQEKAHNLIWNRFCNTQGKQGTNISLDLRLEHLNKLLKSCLKSLGSNFNENSALRISRSIGGIQMVVESVDKDYKLSDRSTRHGVKDPLESVQQMVEDLTKNKIFEETPNRPGYPSFPNFPENILGGLDFKALHSWMKSLVKVWSSMYENT